MNEKKPSIWERQWDITTPLLNLASRFRGERIAKCLRDKVWTPFTLRRVVFTAACMATLIALFYSVENWRGKTAWENYKREMAAKGVNLDWDSYASTNQYLKVHADAERVQIVRSLLQKNTVSVITPEFGISLMPRRHLSVLREYPPTDEALASLPERSPNGVSVADLVALGGKNEPVEVEKQLQRKLIQTVDELVQVSGFTLGAYSRKTLLYEAEWLHAKMVPELKGKGSLEILLLLLKANGFTLATTEGSKELQIKPDISKDSLRAWFEFNRPWMEQLFATLREKGLKLPLDSKNPDLGLMQNFIVARTLAQTFATGAKLELLDGRPDRAWLYLEGQETLMGFLSEPPNTLVSAMIKVSIAGLHANAISDGLRAHAFKPADLRRLRSHLEKFNLLADFTQSWGEWERITIINAVERLPRQYWIAALDNPEKSVTTTKLYLKFAPHGWFLQNLLGMDRKTAALQNALDVPHCQINTALLDAEQAAIDEELSHSITPNNWLQKIICPNTARAFQTTAINQSIIHMLITACALEEYRLEHGTYPVKVAELVPQYLAKVPHDIIDGQPLRYRLEGTDGFVIYSIGWNRKDDGGRAETIERPMAVPKLGFTIYIKDRTQGDWVFPSKAPPEH
jgi:hypothetical protein